NVTNRPLNSNVRVVPANCRFALAVVNAGALVLNLHILRQCTKSPSESGGRPDLLAAGFGDFQSERLAQCRRALTDIDGHKECRASGNSHQFSHGWLPLEMQSAQGATD